MVKLEVTSWERKKFARFLDDYADSKEKSIDVAMRELAAVCARELAYHVQPWGLTAKVGKKFQENIAKQVNKAIRKGNVEGIPGSAGSVHEHYRVRGRVNFHGAAPGGQFKRAPVDRPQVERLIAKRMARAGMAKGAWIAAARDLGLGSSGRVPKWISRHAKRGHADVRIKGRGSTVILHNDVDYIGNVLSRADIYKALQKAYRKQARRMAVTIQKESGTLSRPRYGNARRKGGGRYW